MRGAAAGGAAGGLRARGLRAETLADLVERVALLDHPSQRQIRRLVAARLSGGPEMTVDPVAVAAAAVALQVEASRWARLRVGQELSYAGRGRRALSAGSGRVSQRPFCPLTGGTSAVPRPG